MDTSQVTPYVDRCINLSNEFSMNHINLFINNVTNNLHCKFNRLLTDFLIVIV